MYRVSRVVGVVVARVSLKVQASLVSEFEESR